MENFTVAERRNQLIQLLKVGMITPIIMAYFRISSSTCNNLIKELRESGEWDKKNVSFLNGVKDALKTWFLLKSRKISLDGVDLFRLRDAIEKVLETKRILEILRFSINSVRTITLPEFSSDIPNGYRLLIKDVLKEKSVEELKEDEERFILLIYLSSERDFSIGKTKETWFYPLINDIVSDNVCGLRGSIRPVFEIDVVEKVDNIFSKLYPNEDEILRRYFGIGFESSSFDQISVDMDLAYERSKQLFKRGMKSFKSLFFSLLFAGPELKPTVPTTITPIEDLDISIRAFNVLRSNGIKTIEELVKYKELDLLEFRSMGKRSFDEIITILRERSLELKK